jgi:nicotinamidase-related amidase
MLCCRRILPRLKESKRKTAMKKLPANTALVLIDIQKGFDSPYWGKRNNPQAESNMQKLLTAWRNAKMPVIHVQHHSTEPDSPLYPGQTGNDFKDAFEPIYGEHVEKKKVNSAFIGTTLESYLRTNRVDTLVIAGLTTDHCVSTSTRMAGNLGFNTHVAADATATFNRTGYDGETYTAEEIFATALASLNQEFATVLTTDTIISAIAENLIEV